MDFLPFKEANLGSKYLLIGFRVIFNDLERTPPKPKSPDLGKFLYFDPSIEAHNSFMS